MISTRCTGRNLLNYLTQKKIPYSLTHEQLKNRTWTATLIFNNNTYSGINTRKQLAIVNAINHATDSIFSYLNNNLDNLDN